MKETKTNSYKEMAIKVWSKSSPSRIMYVKRYSSNGELECTDNIKEAKIYKYKRPAEKCRDGVIGIYSTGLFGDEVEAVIETNLLRHMEAQLYNRDGAVLKLITDDGVNWRFSVDEKHDYVLAYMRIGYGKDNSIEMCDPAGGPYITVGYEFECEGETFVVGKLVMDNGIKIMTEEGGLKKIK